MSGGALIERFASKRVKKTISKEYQYLINGMKNYCGNFIHKFIYS